MDAKAAVKSGEAQAEDYPTILDATTCQLKGAAHVGKGRAKTTHKVYFEVHGKGKKRIYFIMGFANGFAGWEGQVKYFGGQLSDEYSVLVADNRGYGNSDVPSGRYTTSEMARDGLDLLDHVGWDTAHIVGISMGGMIALELASIAPKRVRSLTLTSTTPGKQHPPPFKGIAAIGRSLMTKEPKEKIDIVVSLLFPKPWLEQTSDRAKQMGFPRNREMIADRLIYRMKMGRRPQLRGVVSQIGAITTHHVSAKRLTQIVHELGYENIWIVTGTHDNLVDPRNSAYMAKILQCKYSVYEGNGHVVISQSEPRYNAELQAHVDSAQVRWDSR